MICGNFRSARTAAIATRSNPTSPTTSLSSVQEAFKSGTRASESINVFTSDQDNCTSEIYMKSPYSRLLDDTTFQRNFLSRFGQSKKSEPNILEKSFSALRLASSSFRLKPVRATKADQGHLRPRLPATHFPFSALEQIDQLGAFILFRSRQWLRSCCLWIESVGLGCVAGKWAHRAPVG